MAGWARPLYRRLHRLRRLRKSTSGHRSHQSAELPSLVPSPTGSAKVAPMVTWNSTFAQATSNAAQRASFAYAPHARSDPRLGAPPRSDHRGQQPSGGFGSIRAMNTRGVLAILLCTVAVPLSGCGDSAKSLSSTTRLDASTYETLRASVHSATSALSALGSTEVTSCSPSQGDSAYERCLSGTFTKAASHASTLAKDVRAASATVDGECKAKLTEFAETLNGLAAMFRGGALRVAAGDIDGGLKFAANASFDLNDSTNSSAPACIPKS